MKKILSILFLAALFTLNPNDAKGSHMAGGEIWYEFVGNAQYPFRYKVFLTVYRDISGIPLGLTKNICVTSSCFTVPNIAMAFVPSTAPNANPNGSINTPELTDCVDSSSTSIVFSEAYTFESTAIDLPGLCADYTFSFSENARNFNAKSNMTSAGTFYIEAELNNTIGPNSSPKFINAAAKSFCVGRPFIWSQAAVEPDGDSLYYDFGNPLTGNCGGTPTNMTFKAGYTVSQPMSTVNGISINHRYGTFRFTPSQEEVAVINVTVTEYRYANGLWLDIGTSVRDLQVPIIAGCKIAASNGPQFSKGSYPTGFIPMDSIRKHYPNAPIDDSVFDPNSPGKFALRVPVIDYSCFDTLVNLKFKDGVYCETIAPDGTDFRLEGPDGILRPVTGVIDNCRPDLVTKSIDLKLHKALDVNGDYILTIKPGTDGNTLMNKCGFPLDPFFFVIIRVADCPILDYELKNVSVELDKQVRIDWSIEPNSWAPALFTSWTILRANSDDVFYQIEHLEDVTARSFIDTTLEHYNLDQLPYQYRVQLVQNFTFNEPTNQIRTILLQDTVKDVQLGSEVLYEWSTYDGWDTSAYELFVGKLDTAPGSSPAWESVAGPTKGMVHKAYTHKEASDANAGLYVIKVEATDIGDTTNAFVSESNWLYFEIIYDHDPPDVPPGLVLVPNVITPNDDGLNELFTISTDYQRYDIAIYNRWGKLVYESAGDIAGFAWGGQDQNSNETVADGVYYYVLKVASDLDDGFGNFNTVSDEIKGNVSVFGQGTK